MPELKPQQIIESLAGCGPLHEDAAWCAARVRAVAPPPMIARPEDRNQLAAVLRQASQQRLAVSAVGAGSKRLCGGVPRQIDLAVSTEKLNQVIDYPASDLTIRVEAGIRIRALRETLAQQGQMLPLQVPFADAATLGGTLAANLNGPWRLGYGAWRDIVIGLEFATADGKLAKAGGQVVKNVAGYDLPKLHIGAFGTLGIITEVSMKVFPIPPASTTFMFGYDTWHDAAAGAHAVRTSQFFPQALQLLDAAAARIAGIGDLLSSRYSLLVSVAGPAVVIERAQRGLRELLSESLPASVQQIDERKDSSLWPGISDLTQRFLAAHSSGVVVKVSVPLKQLGHFCEASSTLARNAGVSSALSAQAGVGITHVYLWSDPTEPERARLAAFAEQVVALSERLGGRGVVEWFPLEFDGKMNPWGTLGGDVSLMRKIKRTLDPEGILNPGRFYGGI